MSDSESQTTPQSATAAPAPQTVIVRRGGAGTVVVALVLSLLGTAAAIVATPYWVPAVTKLAGIPDPVRKLDAEQARLGRSLGEVEQKVAALGEQVGKLSGSIAGEAATATDLRSATLALAVGELRNALRRNAPFDGELATLRAIAGKDPEVEKAVAGFASFAGTGIPSRAQLRADFPRAASAAVSAGIPVPTLKEAGGWYTSMSSAVTHFAYIVRLDTPPADSAYAIVQSARARLSADDLAGAVDELAKLPAPIDPETGSWLTQAQARVAADRGMAALTTLTMARMGTK